MLLYCNYIVINQYLYRKIEIMGKNLIEFQDFKLDNLKQVALKNKRKINNQSLIELAVEIANNSIQHLDSLSFENVTTLTK